MINFKCSSCGAEMSVSKTGDLVCSYCGSKSVFTDKDLKEYKEFRFRMLSYLNIISDVPAGKVFSKDVYNSGSSLYPEETERIWQNAEQEKLCLSDGRPLTIKYLFKGIQNGVTIYTARKNVIFVFEKGDEVSFGKFSPMVGKLCYPSADIKGLSKFFPVVGGCFELDDNRYVLSVSKDEELYPLSAFGSLPPEHAAWIVSRLENLCCVLAYSGILHNGIDMESVFINARTHQAYLLGGWWNACECTDGRNDLIAVRNVAKRVMGIGYECSPDEFRKFISESPANDAFEDFSLWDTVIEKGFHGRRFRKLDLSSLQI